MAPYVGATDSSSKPTNVNAMPIGSEYGFGRLSVKVPTTGCSKEAVAWLANVMRPICPKYSVPPMLVNQPGEELAVTPVAPLFFDAEGRRLRAA